MRFGGRTQPPRITSNCRFYSDCENPTRMICGTDYNYIFYMFNFITLIYLFLYPFSYIFFFLLYIIFLLLNKYHCFYICFLNIIVTPTYALRFPSPHIRLGKRKRERTDRARTRARNAVNDRKFKTFRRCGF